MGKQRDRARRARRAHEAGPPARVGAAWDIAAVVAELEEVYAQLPPLGCQGLCAHSCGQHVDASLIERVRIGDHGVDLDAPTADGACPALSRALVDSGRCTVHEIRPMMCRLWGLTASMPCPHGCTPAGGVVSDVQALGWMLDSYEIGGHPSLGIRVLIRACMADPLAAGLMSRYLRGDRTVSQALTARLKDLP